MAALDESVSATKIASIAFILIGVIGAVTPPLGLHLPRSAPMRLP
jgi:hypothetical protein